MEAKELKAEGENGGVLLYLVRTVLVGRIMVLNMKEGQVRIPEICEYVTFHGEGGFAEDIRFLRRGEYTELPRWPQWSHKDPKEMDKLDRRNRVRDS